MSRMPFGWKHSPLLCYTAVGRIVRPLLLDAYLLFHFPDDALIPGPDLVQLRAITACVVRSLQEAGFLTSAKSTVEAVTQIFFLGKYVNLGVRTITSHPRAFLLMFNIWLRLATRSCPSSQLLSKALGLIHWHFRPRFFFWAGGFSQGATAASGGGVSSAPHPTKSSMGYALLLSGVWNLASRPRWHVLRFTVPCHR